MFFSKKRKDNEVKVHIWSAGKNREEYIELIPEDVKTHVDKQNNAYALEVFDNGKPSMYLIPKKLWENMDKLTETGFAYLPQDEQIELISKITSIKASKQ